MTRWKSEVLLESRPAERLRPGCHLVEKDIHDVLAFVKSNLDGVKTSPAQYRLEAILAASCERLILVQHRSRQNSLWSHYGTENSRPVSDTRLSDVFFSRFPGGIRSPRKLIAVDEVEDSRLRS